MGAACFFSGISQIIASVVSIKALIEAAFWRAERVTLVGADFIGMICGAQQRQMIGCALFALGSIGLFCLPLAASDLETVPMRGIVTAYNDAVANDSVWRMQRNSLFDGHGSEGPLSDQSAPHKLNYIPSFERLDRIP